MERWVTSSVGRKGRGDARPRGNLEVQPCLARQARRQHQLRRDRHAAPERDAQSYRRARRENLGDGRAGDHQAERAGHAAGNHRERADRHPEPDAYLGRPDLDAYPARPGLELYDLRGQCGHGR